MTIQARHRRQGRVALTTGVAVSEGMGSTTVEVSIPASGTPVVVADGIQVTSSPPNYEDSNVVVVTTSSTGPFRITYKDTALTVYCRYYRSSFFGRYFNCRMGIPQVYRDLGTLGLLGSADDNALNDWMTPEGFIVPIPSSYSARRGSPALDYCSRYWCIRNETESLFSYYDNDDHATYDGCDAGLGTAEPAVDLSTASPELRALCGTDEACLIDGILAGLREAQAQLNEQAALAAAATLGRFRVDPSSVQVNVNTNLAISVDISASGAGTVDKFNLYRVNSEDGTRDPDPILELFETNNNNVFKGTLAVLSTNAGDSFSYQAVAVIGEVEGDPVFTKLNALTSYSSGSGVGGVDNTPCDGTCPDDGDLCTINQCNAATGFCETVNVACGIGEECDSFTGQCQNLQNLVPCVAVIDEWDNRDYTSQWNTFRSRYPQRPFCLLVPNAGVQRLYVTQKIFHESWRKLPID